jgi:hypothetical protein
MAAELSGVPSVNLMLRLSLIVHTVELALPVTLACRGVVLNVVGSIDQSAS